MKLIPSKYYKEDLALGGLFLLLPFLTMPFALFQLFKTRRNFYALLISVFFGLTASLLAPTGDLYRLHITYFDFQEMNFEGFLNFIKVKPDFLFYLLLYLFAKFGISIRLIIFGLVFSYFNISFKLLQKHVAQVSIGATLLFVMQFDFLLYGLFLRFPLAMFLVIYAFLLELKGKKGTLLLLVLASLTHFAALVAIPMYFLLKLRFSRLKLIFLISLFVMPFGSYIFIYLTTEFLEYFPDIPLKSKIDSYFLGYWSLEFFEDRTWKALFQFYAERILYILILVYFIFTKEKNKYRQCVLPFFILVNVLFSFPNLFSRYAMLPEFFGLYTLIAEQRKTSVSQIIKLTLMIMIPAVFFIRIVAQQKNIRVGYMPKILYKNAIGLTFEKYDRNWIETHIDKETARPKNIEPL